jgi:pantothenate synthetase
MIADLDMDIEVVEVPTVRRPTAWRSPAATSVSAQTTARRRCAW